MARYRMKIYRDVQERKNVKHTLYGTNRRVLRASSAHFGLNYGVAGQLAPRINDCSCYVKHPGMESCPESSPTRHSMEVEEKRLDRGRGGGKSYLSRAVV